MFSIGIGELFVLLLVVVIFINPKDLPRLLRAVGRYYGKFLKFREELSRGLKLMELEEAAREEREQPEGEESLKSAGGELAEPAGEVESINYYKSEFSRDRGGDK